MKKILCTVISTMVLVLYSNLQAQTALGGIFASGTTVTVKVKLTSDLTGTFTGGNIGIRWLTSLGAEVDLINEQSSYGYVNQGAKAIDGLYTYKIFAHVQSNASATYTADVEYTLMTVTVSGASGPGEFELCPGGFASDAGIWYIEMAGFQRSDEFNPSNWYYQSTTGEVPLPVELTSLSATAKGRNVELIWKTAVETNNAGFEIQRKQEKSVWTKVGYVEGNGTTAKENSYTYTDAVKSADAYQYRLKQIDRDGTFSYSGQVEAITTLSAGDYALSGNYPNPFNPTTKFSFAVKNNEKVTVKVFNLLGQDVATLFNDVAEANTLYEMNFNASQFASGTYFYMLRTNDRYEIKKMLLMK